MSVRPWPWSLASAISPSRIREASSSDSCVASHRLDASWWQNASLTAAVDARSPRSSPWKSPADILSKRACVEEGEGMG